MTTPDNPRPRHEVPIWLVVEWSAFRTMMRNRRKDLGLTQAEVSERMGRSRDYITVLERNNSTANMNTVFLWAQALGGTVGVDFGKRS